MCACEEGEDEKAYKRRAEGQRQTMRLEECVARLSKAVPGAGTLRGQPNQENASRGRRSQRARCGKPAHVWLRDSCERPAPCGTFDIEVEHPARSGRAAESCQSANDRHDRCRTNRWLTCAPVKKMIGAETLARGRLLFSSAKHSLRDAITGTSVEMLQPHAHHRRVFFREQGLSRDCVAGVLFLLARA